VGFVEWDASSEGTHFATARKLLGVIVLSWTNTCASASTAGRSLERNSPFKSDSTYWLNRLESNRLRTHEETGVRIQTQQCANNWLVYHVQNDSESFDGNTRKIREAIKSKLHAPFLSLTVGSTPGVDLQHSTQQGAQGCERRLRVQNPGIRLAAAGNASAAVGGSVQEALKATPLP
jgi:hypothetical protein